MQYVFVENPGTFVTVERYHVPLRAAYLEVWMNSGRDVTYVDCLKIAVL